jgi:DNA polymerase-1
MGCTTEEASQKIREYKKVIPNITRWLNKNGSYGVNFKETYTLKPYRRRRTLHEEEEWRRRNQGKNTPVQGTGGDILKLALCKIDRYIRKHKLQDKVKLVLCVHDEIITECRKEYAKTWLPIMKKLMDDAALYVLKLPVVTTDPFINKFWPYKDQDLSQYNKLKKAA